MSALTPDLGIHANVMLADFAQVADGKLNVLGGGWAVTGPEPSPFAIAGLFEVPWTLSNRQHQFRFELIDLDGNAVMIETPEGEQEVYFEGAFEVGDGGPLRPGSSQRIPFALNGGPLPLEPGMSYEWRLSINGGSHDDWRLPFITRARDEEAAA